jgi:hypothetical protein
MTRRVIFTKDYSVPSVDPKKYPDRKERWRLYHFPTRKTGGQFDLVREAYCSPTPVAKGYWYDKEKLLKNSYFKDVTELIALFKDIEVGLGEAELLGKLER